MVNLAHDARSGLELAVVINKRQTRNMLRQNPSPPPPGASIWRYLDLAKFISLLETQCLFFSRIDLLGDPFEGSLPVGTIAQYDKQLQRHLDTKDRNVLLARSREILERSGDRRLQTYACCWHRAKHESVAFWKLYGGDYGVSIKSTVDRLRRTLPRTDTLGHPISLYDVKYVDYFSRRTVLDPADPYQRFLHKSVVYRHEQEVRAIFARGNLPAEESAAMSKMSNVSTPGVAIPINLIELIEGVVVSPLAPAWFKGTVGLILNTYHVRVPVTSSVISERPLL